MARQTIASGLIIAAVLHISDSVPSLSRANERPHVGPRGVEKTYSSRKTSTANQSNQESRKQDSLRHAVGKTYSTKKNARATAVAGTRLRQRRSKLARETRQQKRAHRTYICRENKQ